MLWINVNRNVISYTDPRYIHNLLTSIKVALNLQKKLSRSKFVLLFENKFLFKQK